MQPQTQNPNAFSAFNKFPWFSAFITCFNVLNYEKRAEFHESIHKDSMIDRSPCNSKLMFHDQLNFSLILKTGHLSNVFITYVFTNTESTSPRGRIF